MRQKTSPSFLPKTAIFFFFIALVSFSMLLSSFSARKMTNDVWKLLGITKQAGDEKIKNSFTNGYLYYYGVKNIKNLALNERGALAKDLLTYTKQYISSSNFANEYEQLRKSAQPQQPVLKPMRSIEEIQKEEIAKAEKSIKGTEKTMKELPDMAKSFQPLMDILKKNLKDYQNPKNSYFTAIAQGEKYDQENQLKNYKDRMQQWETAYPVNPDELIAERLQKMLDATKDIDYSAELAEKWGKKRFVNPVYESKNPEWKQGFRAGKEVTETARAFAKQWLSELQRKKQDQAGI
jgi:hypothetical protein